MKKINETEEIRRKLESPTLFSAMVLGVTPTRYQAELLENDKDSIVLWARQCVEENEFVYGRGKTIRARELVEGEDTLNGRVSGLHKFEDETYELVFSNGCKIRVNGEHPLWVSRRQSTEWEWKRVSELIQNGGHWYGLFEHVGGYDTGRLVAASYERGKLVGYLLSDGYFNGNQSVKFTNNNVGFIDEVERLAGQEFELNGMKRYPKNKGWDLLLVNRHMGRNHQENRLKTYLLSLGLEGKRTLGDILSFDMEGLRGFLAGFFNGDGYIGEIRRGKAKANYEIGFAVGIYEQVAADLQYILWRLGVSSFVKKEMMAKSKTLFYRVVVSGGSRLKMLALLNPEKYPAKFERAKTFLEALECTTLNKTEGGFRVSIRAIRPLGKRTVIGYSTESGLITMACGLKTHNSGKSTTLASKALHRALTRPRQEILIVAPTLRQAGLMFNKIYDLSEFNTFIKSHTVRHTQTHIEFDNGSKIHCLPSGHEGASLRGFSATMIIFDEAAQIPEKVFLAVRPSMAVRGEQIILSSTPFGKRGYFYTQYHYNEMQKPGARAWDVFKVRAEEVPFYDKEFLKSERETLTADQFAQEYEAEFIADSDSYYPRSLIMEAVEDYEYKLPTLLPPGSRLHMGVDVAARGSDESAFTIVSETAEGEFKVEWAEQHSHSSIPETAGRVVELARNYPDMSIYVDSSGMGVGVVDIVREANVPVKGVVFTISPTL